MPNQLAVSVVVALLFGAVFYAFITIQPGHRINDFSSHIAYAETVKSAQDIRSPHFLFQLLINALHALGLSYVLSTVVLLAVAYGGMALLLMRELQRRDPNVSATLLAVVVPALLFASHIFVFTMGQRNLYWGYFVPVMYTNPTQQLNKLFALWIYLWYFAYLFEDRRPGVWPSAGLGVLCVFSALAKPSFLIAFLPVAGVYGLGDLFHRRWRHVAAFAGGLALPTVAVLLWQARAANDGGGIAIQFAPFALFALRPTLHKLPLSLAFPIAVAVVARGVPGPQDRLRFLWLFVAVSLFYTLAVVESGSAMAAGNFAWSGQTAVFLAYVESAIWLLAQRARLPLARLAWVVFAVHVACGLFWYASNFFPEQDRWL